MAASRTEVAMTLGELIGSAAGAHAATPVADLVLDSRDVRPGAAFVALQGARDHGLRFAAEALAHGAAVVLYEPSHGVAAPDVAPKAVAVPNLKARIGELAQRLYGAAIATQTRCGVTGTNGKTTVAWLIAQAMTRRGETCGYTGTLGYGVPPRLTAHALTTPDSFTLHRELASLDASHAAMEISSHALAQDRIAGLDFDTAAFTNLSRDHLDEHGDLDSYGRAKASLFQRPRLRCAVLNADDPFAAAIARHVPSRAHTIRVGTGRRAADIEAFVRSRGVDGLELSLTGRYGDALLVSPLIGDFNAENLLVALGVLAAWGVPLREACAALEHCTAPPGRLEAVVPPDVSSDVGTPRVVVDYAHTPDGLRRVLEALKAAATGELWCVFGCGGDRDRGKRPLMGEIAAAHADHIVLTDDNPRGEDPQRIVAEIAAGIPGFAAERSAGDGVSAAGAAHAAGAAIGQGAAGQGPKVVVEHDRRRAIMRAVAAARPGDVVLIAGKGHEATQLAGGIARPFSDRDVALEALEARR